LGDQIKKNEMGGTSGTYGMRWAGQVARMGDRRDVYRVLVGILRSRDHLVDLGLDKDRRL